MMENHDDYFMSCAMQQAKLASEREEVPVGAVLVDQEHHVLAQDHNRVEELADPTAHAEIMVIRAACQISHRPRLPGTTLYVTLEPCTLCAAAIAFARISRLVFAAQDSKGGGVIHGARFFNQPTCHHHLAIEQNQTFSSQSAQILRDFFILRRKT